MARISKKQLKQDELVDAAVDASHWLEQHWMLLVKAAVPVLVLILGILGFSYYRAQSLKKTQEQLAQGLRQFDQAQVAGFASPEPLQAALGVFEQVHDKAGSSAEGRVARFYQGVALYRLGRAEEAAPALEEVSSASSAPDTLSVTAQAMLADVHLRAGRYDQAAKLLTELSEATPPVFPPEEALLKLGWVHTRAGNQEEAQRTWQRLLDKYPQSAAAQEVTKLLGPRPGTGT
jgi:TolA-binding protein